MISHTPGTILVIDDEPRLVRALARLLRRDGYQVATASNGRHALAQLQAQPGTKFLAMTPFTYFC
jgi:CheY-like chemotaxis protein